MAGALLLPTTNTSAAAPDAAAATESVRAMTWNICGEAGGLAPTPDHTDGVDHISGYDPGYCPHRNDHRVKATAVADMVAEHNLNAIMVQEICGGPDGAVPAGSELDELAHALPGGWHLTWVPSTRPGDARDTGSTCRNGLPGRYGIALGAKGLLVNTTHKWLLEDQDKRWEQTQVLCSDVVDWQTTICSTHLTDDPERNYPYYGAEVTGLLSAVGAHPNVVFGGDFNAEGGTKAGALSPLYAKYSECDAVSYRDGDASDEPTHLTHHPAAASDNTPTDYYNHSKLDYLFSSAGFTGCDSAQEKADSTEYSRYMQPDPALREPVVPTPPSSYAPKVLTPDAVLGISDHAPLYGYTRGAPVQSLDLSSTSFDGATTFANGAPVSLTGRSFSVAVSAKADGTKPQTGAVVSQDGQHISKFLLWYEQDTQRWRFGMPKTDSDQWDLDVVSVPQAQPGVWTKLVGTYDYQSKLLTLYVSGAAPVSTPHADTWASTSPLVVGTDLVGANRAYFKGGIGSVKLFDYALTPGQVAAL